MATEPVIDPRDREYAPPRRATAAEYLRLAETLAGRHEFWDGVMYPRGWPPGSHWAMAGNTQTHSRLTVRLLAALEGHLPEGPCRVYNGDMRVYVGENRYVYPDASVACGEPIAANLYDLHDAVLICEVRSQSTDAFDRGDKFDGYRRLPSLREYLLLANRRPAATVLRLGDDGVWRYLTVTEGGDLLLESIGLRLSLTHLYRGLALDVDEPRPGGGR